MDYFIILSIFIVFYIIRYFMDSNYKNSAKKYVVMDIFITSVLAIVVEIGIRFLLHYHENKFLQE
jgi:hypothetical protein